MLRKPEYEVIKVGLCKGRHPLPVDDYLFPEYGRVRCPEDVW